MLENVTGEVEMFCTANEFEVDLPTSTPPNVNDDGVSVIAEAAPVPVSGKLCAPNASVIETE